MRRFASILLLATILGSATYLLNNTATAYDKSGCKWASKTPQYDKHTLTSVWKDRVWDGARQWNDVTTSGFTWSRSDSGGNDVTLGAIDGSGDTLAVTSSVCVIWLVETDITFDTAESWYTGTDGTGSIPAGSFDAFSVATHEFGHALGLDHTDLNCNGSPSSRPTMCPSLSATEVFPRTLHVDDKNGLSDLYS